MYLRHVVRLRKIMRSKSRPKFRLLCRGYRQM
nr:MAG TPA: hypothetical protein [Caudoviricetes sp.]